MSTVEVGDLVFLKTEKLLNKDLFEVMSIKDNLMSFRRFVGESKIESWHNCSYEVIEEMLIFVKDEINVF